MFILWFLLYKLGEEAGNERTGLLIKGQSHEIFLVVLSHQPARPGPNSEVSRPSEFLFFALSLNESFTNLFSRLHGVPTTVKSFLFFFCFVLGECSGKRC